MKVLITGITGQDGSYLAEKLLAQGHEVHGIIRRSSTGQSNFWRIESILDKVHLHFGDMTDHVAIKELLQAIVPDQVYNLAAQSQVGISYQCPSYTLEATGVGACNLMECTFSANRNARFYQASSSEMWGRTDGWVLSNEQSPLRPISPYACAKVLAHNYAIMLQKRGLFATVGILNNHESERRGDNFVTTKVCKAAANWQKVNLGYLGAVRDWGYAPEYVDGMILMMNHENPDVFVLGTG
jgi:GDPmannose 4,6-dehydratase